MTLIELYDQYLMHPPTNHQFANPEALEFRFGNFIGKEFRSVPDSYLLSLASWEHTFPKTRRDICDVLVARHFEDFWKYHSNTSDLKKWFSELIVPWAQFRGQKLVSLSVDQCLEVLKHENLNCYWRKLVEVAANIKERVTI